MLNGQQLTNIGVFRKYAENYLRNNPNIEQKEIILVRQLEITPQGMPRKFIVLLSIPIWRIMKEYSPIFLTIYWSQHKILDWK